jgi:hypothetical protein
VPEGQEHHQSVTVTMTVGRGRFDQLLNLVDGQVLPGPQGAIFLPARSDCSILVVGVTGRRRGLLMRNPPLACLTVQYIGILSTVARRNLAN